MTRPTNPTRPLKLTVALTIKEVTISKTRVTVFMLMPMERAISLPIMSRFMACENTNTITKHGIRIAPSMATCGRSEADKSPINQKMMLCNRASCVMETKNMIMAEQKALTITPDSSRASFLKIDFPVNMIKIKARVPKLPRKEVKQIPGNRDRPSNIPIMAPIAEPPDTPSMNGSASGLRSSA